MLGTRRKGAKGRSCPRQGPASHQAFTPVVMERKRRETAMPRVSPPTTAKGKVAIAEAAPALGVSQEEGPTAEGRAGTSCKVPSEGTKPTQCLCPHRH